MIVVEAFENAQDFYAFKLQAREMGLNHLFTVARTRMISYLARNAHLKEDFQEYDVEIVVDSLSEFHANGTFAKATKNIAILKAFCR